MNDSGNSDTGNTVANVGELIMWASAALGTIAVVLTGFAVYLVVRHQGFFYRAKVRSTHDGASEG